MQNRKRPWTILVLMSGLLLICYGSWSLYQHARMFRGIPGSTVIVFESDEGPGIQLYAMNPDGSQVTRLTYHLNQTGWFGTSFGAYFKDIVINQDPSPGSGMVGVRYLTTFDQTSGYQWYSLSLNGEEARLIPTGRAENLYTNLSPNGQFLVYRTSEFDVYLYDTVTHEQRCMNCGHTSDIVYSLPEWSPSGRRLVLSISSQVTHEGHIYSYDLATGQLTQLTHGAHTRYSEPAWSPNESQIAYIGGEQNTEGTLSTRNMYVMDGDGRNQRQLTQSGADQNPAWSPDGQHLVFQSQRAGRVRFDGIAIDLFRIDIDGTNEVRLISDTGSANYTNPVWVTVPK